MASAPRSPTADSSTSWAMPITFDQQQQDTKDKIISELLPLVKNVGGPAQFVRRLLDARSEVQQYATWLWDTFPEDSTTHYEYHRQLPTTDESNQAMTPPLCLHPATLAYTENCSLKTCPTLELLDELLHQILQYWFMTQSEPLLTHRCWRSL